MVKFEVLKTNKSLMYSLGIHSNRLSEPTSEFSTSIKAHYFLFILFFCCLLPSLMFIHENMTQFELTLDALLIIIATTQSGGMFLNVGLQMKTVKQLHLKLQSIVDEIPGEYLIHISILHLIKNLLNKLLQRTNFILRIVTGIMSKDVES